MNILKIGHPYTEISAQADLPNRFVLGDHLNGFSKDLTNSVFDHLELRATQQNTQFTVLVDQHYPKKIHKKYPNLHIKFDMNIFKQKSALESLRGYTLHPDINFCNFLCSFNGGAHVSRKLLVAALNQFGMFDKNYCSKNFSFSIDELDGHIQELTTINNRQRFFRKFLVTDQSQDFFQTVYSFGHDRFEHARNVYSLESIITKSFVHVVSETMATSYYPFVTEKFLYSVVTRGLFLAYAQPGWHRHLEKYYGFRLYTNLFNYQFDEIACPIERLIELMSMISKFSTLSMDDLKNLYELEVATIEYNRAHYFSGDYLKSLEKFI